MKKIAVVFPGVGYTKDRPLLYYAGKLAVANGYELIHLDFSDTKWTKDNLKNRDFMLNTVYNCISRAKETIKASGDLSGADLLFISKSIGTVVSAATAHELDTEVKQIYFSPLEYIDGFMVDEKAVLFYGDADPYADHMKIEEIAGKRAFEAHCISGGNHSLETGDIQKDIENLGFMMKRVGEIIQGD